MANKNTAVSASSETAVGEELNTKRKKARRIRKRRSLLFDFLKLAAFSVLLVYSVVVIISNQADIAQQEAAIEKLEEEIAQTQRENDEYTRLLADKDETEYMLSAAIERGYAYPREVRFYPKNILD